MKKIIPILFMSFLIYSLTNKEEIYIPDYAIRFRIIANSNNESDQELKQEIKSALELKLDQLMQNATSSEEAKTIITENMNEIEAIVNAYTTGSTVSFGKNYFPSKEYKGVIYPSGEYESLVITLGSGKGKNWWCIMFPPLCLLEGKETNTDDVTYSFYVKELLEKFTS